MQRADESVGATSITITGSFNPAIISPAWLLGKDLIDELDYEAATEPDSGRTVATSAFSAGRYPWLTMEMARDAMRVYSTPETETPERLREFVVGLFAALPETPISGLAVSHFWHVAAEKDRWDRIAATLAPREPWDAITPESLLETVKRRVERESGHLEITVEPSHRDDYDIYVDVEQRWDLDQGQGDSAALVRVLDENWDALVETADRVRVAILELG